MEDYIEIIRRIRTCVSFIFCILYFLIKKKNHYINVKLNLRTRKGDSYLYVYERIEILYSRRRRTTTTQQNKEEDKIKSVYRCREEKKWILFELCFKIKKKRKTKQKTKNKKRLLNDSSDDLCVLSYFIRYSYTLIFRVYILKEEKFYS